MKTYTNFIIFTEEGCRDSVVWTMYTKHHRVDDEPTLEQMVRAEVKKCLENNYTDIFMYCKEDFEDEDWNEDFIVEQVVSYFNDYGGVTTISVAGEHLDVHVKN